jgi:hypothetical protein
MIELKRERILNRAVLLETVIAATLGVNAGLVLAPYLLGAS